MSWPATCCKAQAIKIGDPADETSRMGPVINEGQYKKVLGYIQVGTSICCLMDCLWCIFFVLYLGYPNGPLA